MITDDELLLHHYRELEPADRARIGAALGADPELARRLHALVARLDAAAAQPEVPVPEHVQRRWQAALDRAAAQPRAIAEQRRFFTPLRLQMAATAVVVFALTLSFQKMLGPDTHDTVAASNPDPAAVDANAYANGLKWHLASTERRLASLSDARTACTRWPRNVRVNPSWRAFCARSRPSWKALRPTTNRPRSTASRSWVSNYESCRRGWVPAPKQHPNSSRGTP
jgi:hypothetical protein